MPNKAHIVDHDHEFVPSASIGADRGHWCCVHDGCHMTVMGTPICDETFWSIVSTDTTST